MSKEPIDYKNSQAQLTITDHETKFRQLNAWQSRTSLERALIIFSLLCLIGIVALLVAYVLTRPKIDAELSKICLDEGCIKAANDLLLSMNREVDPCDDFFEYACGNWNKRHIIPEDRGSYNTFTQLRDELQVILKNIFEDRSNMSPSSPDEMVRDLYDACMNETAINLLKGQPLIDTLNMIIKGWPLLMENWDPDIFDWINVTAALKAYGGSYLINFYIYADNKNTSNNIPNLDQTSLGLLRDYLTKDIYHKQRDAYETFIIDIVKLLNNNKITSNQLKDIRDILNFEKQLVNITSPPEERRNQTRMYNKMTISELQAKYGENIDFQRYFSLVLPPGSHLEDNDSIIITEVKYYELLGELIKTTDKKIIANYLGWRFSQRYIGDLSSEFRVVVQKYDTVLSGTSAQEARWRTCVNFVNSNLGLAAGMLYVKLAFQPGSKDAADSMIQDLRKSFAQILQDLDWMDSETKKFGKEKLDKMIERIGYPKAYEDPGEIEKEYKGLIVTSEGHFVNKQNLQKFWTDRELKDLRTGFNKTRWSTDPAIVNAYYNFLQNSITFPAGILQMPFFDAQRPRSMNYGAVGMVIGHEITHGFDDQGRQFDSNGNLYQWWSDEAETQFIKKSQCIIDQYKSYLLPEVNMTLNGINTQGENIADNGGLKEAYMAYKKISQNLDEPLLPGLNFSHDQLFFLSFASVWCGTYREQALRIQVLNGAHSPGKYRVIGTLSNSKEFLTAFNCPKDSNMYREEPCKVW